MAILTRSFKLEYISIFILLCLLNGNVFADWRLDEASRLLNSSDISKNQEGVRQLFLSASSGN